MDPYGALFLDSFQAPLARIPYQKYVLESFFQ